jgi:hypothetical protein
MQFYMYSYCCRTDRYRIGAIAILLFYMLQNSRREADHSPPSSAKVKNAWNYTSTPPIYLHSVVLT